LANVGNYTDGTMKKDLKETALKVLIRYFAVV
jgi:hypothetical protein